MKTIFIVLIFAVVASARIVSFNLPYSPNVRVVHRGTGRQAHNLAFYDPNGMTFWWTADKERDFAGTYFFIPLDPNDPNMMKDFAWTDVTITGIVPLKTLKANKYGCTPSGLCCLNHRQYLACPHGCKNIKKHKCK